MTMPPFFQNIRLSDDQLDRVNDRRGEQGHKNGIEGKGADRLSGVHPMVFVFNGDDNESSHDQAAQLKIGEAGCTRCGKFGKPEGGRKQNDPPATNSVDKNFFMVPLLLFFIGSDRFNPLLLLMKNVCQFIRVEHNFLTI